MLLELQEKLLDEDRRLRVGLDFPRLLVVWKVMQVSATPDGSVTGIPELPESHLPDMYHLMRQDHDGLKARELRVQRDGDVLAVNVDAAVGSVLLEVAGQRYNGDSN